LGMANLMGSGLIARETAKAYKNVVTISYVTARTVGIGAYLVRLAQRIIQCAACPILLTGYQALNNLLGKEVYGSNLELGGLGVMLHNGVSHLSVNSDLEGVKKSLEWLSFVPARRHEHFPLPKELTDPITRKVEAFPEAKTGYDPRILIAGDNESLSGLDPYTQADTTDLLSWVPGFFDKDSFVETLSNWAKTVVTGRARLGGIPMGVIAVETRKQESIYPTDPANPNSREEILEQAGQVWYPDSAFKTAQAIKDMNVEDLPLMIFANWRGFSGGQRDMFHQVLKFGSYIVDALTEYKHPVFVYLPPLAELRGGAWVVLDTNINPDCIEMYSSESARGGVLEPSGAAGLKFRGKRLLAAATRLDPVLSKFAEERPIDASHREELGSRERMVLPIYRTIAVHFADLHDTPDGMEKKKGIRKVVRWEDSREFFYWRLRNLMQLRELARPLKQYTNEIDESPVTVVKEILKKHVVVDNYEATEDQYLVEWMSQSSNRLKIEEDVNQRIKSARHSRVVDEINTMEEDDVAELLKEIMGSRASSKTRSE